MGKYQGEARINLGALKRNYDFLASQTRSLTAAVVKANAYGFGLSEVANALQAPLSCVAQVGEALELRESYDGAILTWIWTPDIDIAEAVRAGLEISVGDLWQIDAIKRAVEQTGTRAKIHVEVDTGMARAGFGPRTIGEAATRIAGLGDRVERIGVWSHLARADEWESGETERATALFEELAAPLAGFRMKHLAATGGLLWHPSTHYDLVRAGISIYGMSPNMSVATAEQIGLEPVMTLTARLTSVREVGPDTGVSYGHLYRSESAMWLGTVPLGYADGLPRSMSNVMEVSIGGERYPLLGRQCMDQFVMQVPPTARAGDEVTIFGGDALTIDEFAERCETIGYEVTTQLAPRLPRTYVWE